MRMFLTMHSLSVKKLLSVAEFSCVDLICCVFNQYVTLCLRKQSTSRKSSLPPWLWEPRHVFSPLKPTVHLFHVHVICASKTLWSLSTFMPDSLSWSRHKLLVWKQFPQSDQKTRLCNLCSCRRRSMKREWSNRACNLQAKWFRKTMQPVQTFFYIVLVIYFKKRPQCWMPLLCLVFAEKEFWLRTATDRGLVVWRPVADSGCLTGRGGKKKQNIKGTTCLHGAQKVLMYLWWREGTSPGFVHWKRALYHALSKRTL